MIGALGVVLIDPKYSDNVGATIRACSCFGVESLVWTGEPYNCQCMNACLERSG